MNISMRRYITNASLEFTISNLQRDVAAVLQAVNTLTDSHNISKDELKQLRVDFDIAQEQNRLMLMSG